MPCHLPMPYDGQWQHPATAIPANADCRGGVFAARRFPRPPQYTYTMPPTETPVFITTRHAASLQKSNRSPRLSLGGCAPPPPPRPLSLDRQRKGGKKARPWRRPRGFCLRRATPALRRCPCSGVAGVARTGPRPKAPHPTCTRQGQKRRTGHPTKNALPLELSVRG